MHMTGDMGQLGKHLLCWHNELNLASQNPHLKVAMLVCACDPTAEDTEAGRSLNLTGWPASQAKSSSSGLSERPASVIR